MADLPAYIRNFKAYTRGDLTLNDLPGIEAEVYGGQDRATALVLGSMLESALQMFVWSKTRPTLNADDSRDLFDLRGPLGDFSSKIMIVFAFNWVGPDTRHDLDLVRLIRNEYAHSRRSFTFETAECAAVCAQFRAPDSLGAFIPKRYLDMASDTELVVASDKMHPRTRFVMTCHTVSERLLLNKNPQKQPPDLP